MLNSTDSIFFDLLYAEIKRAYLDKKKTEHLTALLTEVSIDIKDKTGITVAGKYASQGKIKIASWCYEILGASPLFIGEGLIRGSRENPALEEEAVAWCRDEQVNPIALLRGYAFIGQQTKVKQCLEENPNLVSIHSEKKGNFDPIKEELAISALLGNQIEYYQEIQQGIEKRYKKTERILITLGGIGNLPLIQSALFSDEGYSPEEICILIRGVMAGTQSVKCIEFLENQLPPNFKELNKNKILLCKAIGAACTGDFAKTQQYLDKMEGSILHHRFNVSLHAIASGYQAVGTQLYSRVLSKVLPKSNMMRILYAVAKNGMLDRLPSLLDSYYKEDIDSPTLKDDYDRSARFEPGFSLFWSEDSAKHCLGRIANPKVTQFFLPVLNKNLGPLASASVENYTKKIKVIMDKNNLNYRQATCFLDGKQAVTYISWLTSRTLPRVGEVTLPLELVYRVTSFFSPSSPLTDIDAQGLHDALNTRYPPKATM